MSYPTDASGEPGAEISASVLLRLSPLLVMATNVVDALGLAIVAFAALVTAGVVIVPIRNHISEAARWPASMLAIGLCTSTIMLLLQAFAFDLYQRIAFMVPIVIVNWFVLAHLDRTPHRPSFAINSVTAAFGSAAALAIVGIAGEAIGHGTLLAGSPAIDALPAIGDLKLTIADSGFLLAAMPSGAFIIAGLLLAARNAARNKWSQRI